MTETREVKKEAPPKGREVRKLNEVVKGTKPRKDEKRLTEKRKG